MNAELEKQKIRQVIEDWLRASKRGDTEKLLAMMAEDVVFLLPGREPMRGHSDFAAASKASSGKFRFVAGAPDVQEVLLIGDYAICWNYLEVRLASSEDGKIHHHTGDILSVFRKEADGRWVIFRDANLLTLHKNQLG